MSPAHVNIGYDVEPEQEWRRLMSDQIIDILLDEGKWLPVAMFLSTLAVALTTRGRPRPLSGQLASVGRAMNLFYGCMIGVMANGHLLAVTLKTSSGAITGSLWVLYPIGFALAVPAWWLAVSAPTADGRHKKKAMALNAWLGLTLLALGLHNWPLAAPAGLNIAFQLSSGRRVALRLAIVTAIAYLALFIGSLLFLASGRSFEQFMGIE